MAYKRKTNQKRSNSPQPDKLDMELTTSELAILLDTSPTYIGELTRDKGLPKLRHGWYRLRDAVQWYIEALMVRGDRAELIKQQTERTRLQNQLTRREVVSAAEHRHLAGTLATMMTNSLDGLGPRLANQLSSETDPRRITEIVTDECRHIRAQLAAAIKNHADEYGSVEAGGQDSGPAAET